MSKEIGWGWRDIKRGVGPICCAETSVRSYQSTLCNIQRTKDLKRDVYNKILVTQPPDNRHRNIIRIGYCCWSATVRHVRTDRAEEPDVSIWLRIGANGKDPTGVTMRLTQSVTAPVERCHNWRAFHFCCSFLRLGTLARAAYSVQSIFYAFLNIRLLSTANSASSSLLTDC